MNHSPKSFQLALLIFILFVTGCSQPAAKPAIALKPCSGYWNSTQARCGTLRVYENRQAHSGRMIDLKVVVFKATSKTPAPDPIFYLSGGPGGAAASEDARNQQLPYELSENHDLVFVDQRGTGESNQVMIPTDQPDFTGMTPEQIDATAKKWVADYLASINMDPRYYTTSVAMDDLDEVREALGYEKINVVGFSYGTIAAQYYLRQHENHTRTITLLVGSLLDVPINERWAQNTQQALDNIFALCAAQLSCQAAFPNLKAEFEGLMQSLTAEPKVVPVSDKRYPQLTQIIYDADYFSGTVRAMMKDAKNDPFLPLYIHRAAVEDNWKAFVDFNLGGGGPEWWGSQMMDHVIRCSEKWATFDPARVAELSQGSFMSIRDTALAQETAMSCQYSPKGITPEGQSLQPGSDVPVLAFNGSLDPIEPPANVEEISKLFPNSLAVTLPYQAHQQSNMTSIFCMWSIMNGFVQSGSVEGLDTSCMDDIRPPTFVAPLP